MFAACCHTKNGNNNTLEAEVPQEIKTGAEERTRISTAMSR